MCEPRASTNWKARAFKTTASEGRSLLPVLAHWARKVLLSSDDPVRKKHGALLLLLSSIAGLLFAAERGRANEIASALEQQTRTYLAHFKALYGEEVMTIKSLLS